MEKPLLTPSDLVASINQTFEFAYGQIMVTGEISNFRVSKNRWIYFDLKDEQSSVKCFGTVYQLPGPLEDGLSVVVRCSPKLHPQFGFSLTVASIQPVGEGSIKKAANLLLAKLTKEGLFEQSRKRQLPYAPARIGLITSVGSAAYADFIKILNERWGGVAVAVLDVLVQGMNSPQQLVEAISFFNSQPDQVDVLIIIRGGGSADDLAAFNDEHVVRAVATSRVPTLVAIGHETDFSLAELAADMRASTPSNAAQLLVPDKNYVLSILRDKQSRLDNLLLEYFSSSRTLQEQNTLQLNQSFKANLDRLGQALKLQAQLFEALSPKTALKRGYAFVRKNGHLVKTVKNTKNKDFLNIELSDGTIGVLVTEVKGRAKASD